MKLSEAIEEALLNGLYERSNYFMCHAMHVMNQMDHKATVQQMVYAIQVGGRYGVGHTLFGALNTHCRCVFNGKATDAVTTEFYVWWVFDLKRKGL